MGFQFGCQGRASTVTYSEDCKSAHWKSKELQHNSSVYLEVGEKQEQMMCGKCLLLQLIMLTQDHTQASHTLVPPTADPMPSQDPGQVLDRGQQLSPTAAPQGRQRTTSLSAPPRSPWMGTGKSPSLPSVSSLTSNSDNHFTLKGYSKN